MNMLSKVNKYAILAGDFNLNLLKINEGTAAGSFVDSFVSFGFLPLITLPSRFDKQYQTWSLIDNILFRNADLVPINTFSAVFVTSLSDHYPCIAGLDLPFSCNRPTPPKFIKICKQNDENILQYKEYLQGYNIMDQLDLSDNANPNSNYDTLDTLLISGRERFLPSKFVKFDKHKHFLNNWMTEGILISTKFRDSLHLEMIRSPTNSPEYISLLRPIIIIIKKF